ncbi:hypothetical protein tloyanaT_32590 [Thalassotalea loyana]|uniref:Uncharacterized protein n=1 Tax=Thalassotalea loyana TaxID=280483 RepID=A0ABQ6HJL2_9GAMM|nr:hypothetical protein [Thalassotalea loyana]GLX87006.1 hypothetical protein tloyanaT_32590 [Thalassotalea loyana]
MHFRKDREITNFQRGLVNIVDAFELMNSVEIVLTNPFIHSSQKHETVISLLTMHDKPVLVQARALYLAHMVNPNQNILQSERDSTGKIILLIENILKRKDSHFDGGDYE